MQNYISYIFLKARQWQWELCPRPPWPQHFAKLIVLLISLSTWKTAKGTADWLPTKVGDLKDQHESPSGQFSRAGCKRQRDANVRRILFEMEDVQVPCRSWEGPWATTIKKTGTSGAQPWGTEFSYQPQWAWKEGFPGACRWRVQPSWDHDPAPWEPERRMQLTIRTLAYKSEK